jgi:8-oxo-dGTP pyrophosphatase MutT (NUDIX family)
MAAPHKPSPGRAATPRPPRRLEETSAGGVVLDRPGRKAQVALIARRDRRGRLVWSLPKGHLESGETLEQTALREVREETGLEATIVMSLGSIDFWFMADGARVHKTVHHFLMHATTLDLSDADAEVDEVAWVPLSEAAAKLRYAGERRTVETVVGLVAGPSRSRAQGSARDA